MLRTATEMAKSNKWRSRILEKPEIWGLESISAEALIIRIVMKVRTSSKDDVARELRVRLKHALDEMGVKLPSMNSVVLAGFDSVTRVKGARPPRTAPNAVVPGAEPYTPKAKPPRAAKRRPADDEGTTL
jgi:small conductance mechanosensitive channel